MAMMVGKSKENARKQNGNQRESEEKKDPKMDGWSKMEHANHGLTEEDTRDRHMEKLSFG
jgi:hypothetical protein